jgi:hypothetical protein
MVPTERGAAYRVCLPLAPGSAPTVSSVPMRGTQDGEATELAVLVRDLQSELLRRTEAAAVWQTRAELLSLRLDPAHEQLRALEAPKSHESQEDANLTAEAPDPTTTPSDPPSGPTPAPTPEPIPPDEDGRQPW